MPTERAVGAVASSSIAGFAGGSRSTDIQLSRGNGTRTSVLGTVAVVPELTCLAAMFT